VGYLNFKGRGRGCRKIVVKRNETTDRSISGGNYKERWIFARGKTNCQEKQAEKFKKGRHDEARKCLERGVDLKGRWCRTEEEPKYRPA